MRIESLNHRSIESLPKKPTARPWAFESDSVQMPKGSVQRAFTLLEIMVAIVIIGILAGILMVALKGVFRGNYTNQTKATLSTLRGMLTEYENSTHFQNPPVQWEWAGSGSTGGTGGAIVIEPNYDTNSVYTGLSPANQALYNSNPPDFWHISHYNTSSATNPLTADPLVAPTLMVGASPDRYGSVAVINTQIVMNLLASLPVNKATLQSTNNKVTDLLQWENGSTVKSWISNGGLTNGATSPYQPIPNLPAGFSFGLCWNQSIGTSLPFTCGTAAETAAPVVYVLGVQVAYTNSASTPPTTYWRWINNQGAAISVPQPNTSPPTAGNWAQMTTAPTPLFLDAWGNPIIFVPGSGLLVRSSAQLDQNKKPTPILVQSPDHKPFWASAGPDGDFSNGDDNIYSFEQ